MMLWNRGGATAMPAQEPVAWWKRFSNDHKPAVESAERFLAKDALDLGWRPLVFGDAAPQAQPALSDSGYEPLTDEEFIDSMDSNGIGQVDPEVAFAIKELVEAHIKGNQP